MYNTHKFEVIWGARLDVVFIGDTRCSHKETQRGLCWGASSAALKPIHKL